MDVVHQWRQGVVYPRWASLANYGYGEPRFIFYPPISWLLGAALSIPLPWRMVPGVFYFLTMLLAGGCMFRLAREWLSDADATFAGVVYAVNPYHQLIVYWRSDFAEMLASAILPLTVLFAIRAGNGERRALPPLSMLVAAAWLMNAPAAVVTTYTVALLVAIAALAGRTWRGVALGAISLLLGFALAAFYILPAAYEQRWVNIAEALSVGLKPAENFLFTRTLDPEHTWFNWIVSAVAFAEIVAVALAVLGADSLRRRRHLWWPILSLVGASTLLMFRVTMPAWRYLPELRFVQFPWRWLFALNVGFAALLASCVGRRRLLWGFSIAALAVCAFLLARNAWWDVGGVDDLAKTYLFQGHGYEGTDEYCPRGADHYDLDPKAPRIAVLDVRSENEETGPASGAQQPATHIDRWRVDQKRFTVRAELPVTLALRILNYPAWQVTINGTPASASSREGTGQMLIAVPQGSSRVDVRFTRTPDRLLATVVSAVALFLWLFLVFLQRSRDNGTHTGHIAQP